MDTRIEQNTPSDLITPPSVPEASFSDAKQAVAALEALYRRNTTFLREQFFAIGKGAKFENKRYRAFYPQVRVSTTSFSHVDSRLSYGHVPAPGTYTTTITHPKLFRPYLEEQLALLIKNHDLNVIVGESNTPIPLHFAFGDDTNVEASVAGAISAPNRDIFDTPMIPRWRVRCRLPRSRLRGSIIPSPACPITRPPQPNIFRTSSCSRTTSFMSTNSAPMQRH